MLYVGTSGFSYAAWRGAFYPRSLKSGDMLAYYAQHLDTVDVDQVFQRHAGPAEVDAVDIDPDRSVQAVGG